jgi:hypothetical protein
MCDQTSAQERRDTPAGGVPHATEKMRPASLVLLSALLLATCRTASALALGKLLAKERKPIVVELRVDRPAEAWALDVEEASARLRKAGCSALIAPRELLGAICKEQAGGMGNFPGPVPVLCEVGLERDDSVTSDRAAELKALKADGASGVAVTCADGKLADALKTLLADSAAAQLDCLVVAGAEEVARLAEEGGAAAVVCAFDDERAAASGSTGSAAADTVRLRAWDGDDDALTAAREAGFTKFVLLDGCGGELAPPNAAWCEGRVRAFRTQKSSQWGGSMFASTNSDVAPPGVRNPRMWAQSQRQAREIMYESAKSRDLPPPKLSRNTVL